MKLLLTTIAAVVLVGCGESQSPEPPKAKAPDISIHDAAEEGNIEAVKHHLAAGVDVNWKNIASLTPLHYAAHNGHKEIAELLIANGANVNAKMDNGFTSLHWAAIAPNAHEGHKEVAELLIAEGADVNAKDRVGGGTPLDWADGETADLIRKHGGKHGTIHSAAGGGDIEAVKEFLAAGADANAMIVSGPIQGSTPLDMAILNDEGEITDLIRKHGGKTAKELKAEGK